MHIDEYTVERIFTTSSHSLDSSLIVAQEVDSLVNLSAKEIL